LNPGSTGSVRCVVSKNGACSMVGIGTVGFSPSYVQIVADQPTVCAGQSTHIGILSRSYSGTPSYVWSTGATGESIIAGPGTYTVTQTDAIGCPAVSNTVTIVADSAPQPALTVSPAQACSTSTVTATITNSSSYPSGVWFRSSGSVQSIGVANAVHVLPPAAGVAFWIEGDGYTANGCTVTTHVDIPIVPTPNAAITAPGTVCEWNDYVASVADAGP